MDAQTVGHSAMVGWRAKLGDRIAEPVARRSRFDADQVYAAVGLVFLALSLWYVVSTFVRMARRG
jgi:hypothetical protein